MEKELNDNDVAAEVWAALSDSDALTSAQRVAVRTLLQTASAADLAALQSTITSLLASGVLNPADIINNLTTGGAGKVLSAEQGKVLKLVLDSKLDADKPQLSGSLPANLVDDSVWFRITLITGLNTQIHRWISYTGLVTAFASKFVRFDQNPNLTTTQQNNFRGYIGTGPTIASYITPQTLSIAANQITFNGASGVQRRLTLSGNATLQTPTNIPDGASFQICGEQTDGYSLALSADYVVRSGDVAEIQNLGAGEPFEISGVRVGGKYRVWITA